MDKKMSPPSLPTFLPEVYPWMNISNNEKKSKCMEQLHVEYRYDTTKALLFVAP